MLLILELMLVLIPPMVKLTCPISQATVDLFHEQLAVAERLEGELLPTKTK